MKAIPSAVKKLRGTLQPCRNTPELQVNTLPAAPEPPDTLNIDGATLWRQMAGTLTANRALAAEDLPALELLCGAWAAVRAKIRNGIAPTAAEMGAIRLLFVEFGMTPASRRKVQPAAPEKKTNPFAKFVE